MRINNKENIKEILLVHKGTQRRFYHQLKPNPFPYAELFSLEKKETAEIVFEDIQEIDALIDMLNRFKKNMQETLGTWRDK
jgi:hypothetical protein